MNKKSIAIILCLKNGERFIQQQLESIRCQSYEAFDLFISDDGSEDASITIVNEFIRLNSHLTIHVLSGPLQGFAKNFISSLQEIYKCNNKKYDYYAFSDQDDIWDKNKLATAINYIEAYDKSQPILYCSRTRYISEKGLVLGSSPLFKKPSSFQNALVQSIAGGNTMVFNSKTCALISNVNTSKEIISHDWLVYLLVAASDGKIIYDNKPKISYRQHDKNIIGSNNNIFQIIKRSRILINGTFGAWINSNIEHINPLSLSEDNHKTLKSFQLIKSSNILNRYKNFKSSNIYRQTIFGNITIYIAVFLNRIN